MHPRFLLASFCCIVAVVNHASAQPIAFESANPAEIGLSSKALNEVTRLLQRHVDQGKITGSVAAIARHGRLGYLQAVGHQDSNRVMSTDALFRIASMTKAITSAGVMSLVEDGKLSLDDPLSKYLPEFASPRVLRSNDGDDLTTIPAAREPTIHDLLTHRSGLTYGWFGPEKLDAVYRQHNIPDLFVPTNETLAPRVSRIAKVPLKFQPGSAWDYSVATDVLGRAIEVASGLPLDMFLRERLFRPLGMSDTHFALPKYKEPRLAALYTVGEDKSLFEVSHDPTTAGFLKFSSDYCDRDNRFFSGGGGLVSSTTDYLRFLQMLLNDGVLDGHRVLHRESVALMTSNQIGEMKIPFPGHGDGFGFGFGVVTDKGASAEEASVGSYSWGGIFNTYFWVDPQEQLIGVLMTQLFPYDHLDLRTEFKRLAYQAIDDSGFERVYWYQPGKEHANPHFNGRQLRVNAAEASVHPEFAPRSESQSSGMARILIDEDLRRVRRVDLSTEIWGGHPGTANKRVTINGRSALPIPDVGTVDHHCTHQYPAFNLRPKDLVNGYNSLQFACDQGDTFWGHYIVDNAAIRVGLPPDAPWLAEHHLAKFCVSVVSSQHDDGSIRFRLQVPEDFNSSIAAVHYQAYFFGYDENGNGWTTDWHGMTKDKRPYGIVGTATESPYEVEWDTTMIPAQKNVRVRAIIEFASAAGLRYRTRPLKDLKITQPNGESVRLCVSRDVPSPFWSRANRKKTCTIDLDVDPSDILEAELHVVAWTGGAGAVNEYFTLNGKHLPVAEGSRHETIYSRIQVDPAHLRRGKNEIVLLSETTHHGIEILLPGPALAVRVGKASSLSSSGDHKHEAFATQPIRFTLSAKDESAGGIDCYKIETNAATYFLDKVGAGLSSMIDPDGNDWLGFHPQKGTGAAGEYRGFPNAVFKEAGSYFHARNSGTDPCVTIVEEVTDNRVVISASSHNGLWAGKYTFNAEACTFTMTKRPDGHNYWVLYEGVPGGQYDDSDWWMTSSTPEQHQLTSNHEGDIKPATHEGPEWIAFGDKRSPRMLVVSHHEDDEYTDRYYQMQKKMTVFGFGRDGMKKFHKTTPQSFSIGFVESTKHEDAERHASEWLDSSTRSRSPATESIEATAVLQADLFSERRMLERFALRHPGDADAGKDLFFKDARTKCSTCHRVNGIGGDVGPDLSKVGGKFDRPHLIESILEPSKQIVEGYRTSVIVTKDGLFHTGIAKSDSDLEITLVAQDNSTRSIVRADIEQQQEANVSLMPTGVADLLSPQEFTNLVAYLETRQTGKARFGSGVMGPVQLPDGFEISTVATGLSGATAFDVSKDGRIFICEQHGSLRVVKDGRLLDESALMIDVEHNWERGLIGVTTPPDFPADPYIYVVYVTDKPYTHHRVSRYRMDGDKAAHDSEQILLKGDDQSKFGGNVPAGHQGGAIHFGTDGKLYIGIGEQTAKTPAQRFDALQGKLLRINPNGSIPEDNPFFDATSDKYRSIWAMGCRNPFTFAVQRSTGAIFINDVGGEYEEVNRGIAGANYGWPTYDHGPADSEAIASPIHSYPEASISGGDFASDDIQWPVRYRGKYFFADFVHGWIKTIDPASPGKSEPFAAGLRRPVDIRFSSDGSLYVLLRNAWVVDGKFEGGTGALMRIRREG